MLTAPKRLMREESAQDLAEYGLLLAIVAGVVAIIVVSIGQNIETIWQHGQTAVHAVANP